MPYAVEIAFDPASEARVRSIWTALEQNGIDPGLPSRGARPHLSLAVFDEVDPETLCSKLELFAPLLRDVELRISSVGSFLTHSGVIYLAPVVTQDILELHQHFHQSLEPLQLTVWEYYRPRHWVPHCTLAEGLSEQQLPKAMLLSLEADLHIPFRVHTIALAAFPPIRIYCSYPVR